MERHIVFWWKDGDHKGRVYCDRVELTKCIKWARLRGFEYAYKMHGMTWKSERKELDLGGLGSRTIVDEINKP